MASKNLNVLAVEIIGWSTVGLFLIWMVFRSVSLARTARASEKWPTVSAVVLRTEIKTEKGYRAPDRYLPAVEFLYHIDGSTYHHGRLSVYQWACGSQQEAELFLENYPVGKQVTLCYNPKKPAYAVLERGDKKMDTSVTPPVIT